MKLSALFSFLPACAPKPPQGPGVSAALQYPVLLLDSRQVLVKADQNSLITTSAATGINFIEFTLIDSAGRRFSIPSATPFGQKSVWLDMGTSRYQVFLQLKPERAPSLPELQALIKQTALRPDAVKDPAAAARKIDAATSIPQLIEICSTSWDW